MLTITVPAVELWDEKKQEFVYGKKKTLVLEHSLVSLSKWESKWHKPFLSDNNKTMEELKDYIRCMTITQNVKDEVYDNLTMDNVEQIQQYINDKMTATWFSNTRKPKTSNEQVTSELIYYWMAAQNIPIECQKWHLNRLLTLIRVCSAKSEPPKKMSQREIMQQNAAINAKRRKMLGSKSKR